MNVFVARISSYEFDWDFLELHSTEQGAIHALAQAIREDEAAEWHDQEYPEDMADVSVISKWNDHHDGSGLASWEEVEIIQDPA